jgi:AhpD family alkylhydroperoxidase
MERRRQSRLRSYAPVFTLLATVLLPAVAVSAKAGTPAETARAEIVAAYGFLPGFFKALPDNALPGAWAEMKQFQDGTTALPNKIKDLIGLAVAAQAGARGSVYAYSRCAQAFGATEAEVKESVTMAALTRHWSTIFNGLLLDETKYRADTARMVDYLTKMATGKVPPPKPIAITDARSALDDAKQMFGFVPDFVQRVPAEALPGAWLELKSVEMNPETAIAGKYKSLIGLAVASQIPCRYCVIADTEFAKLDGATDREINEAITMAGLARHWITLGDGLQIDEKQFRRDIDRLVQGAGATKTAAVVRH